MFVFACLRIYVVQVQKNCIVQRTSIIIKIIIKWGYFVVWCCKTGKKCNHLVKDLVMFSCASPFCSVQFAIWDSASQWNSQRGLQQMYENFVQYLTIRKKCVCSLFISFNVERRVGGGISLAIFKISLFSWNKYHIPAGFWLVCWFGRDFLGVVVSWGFLGVFNLAPQHSL